VAEKLWRSDAERRRDFDYFERLEVEAMKQEATRRPDAATTGDVLSPEVLRDIVAIAKQRAALVMRLKEALLDDDEALALKLAREVCGLEQEP